MINNAQSLDDKYDTLELDLDEDLIQYWISSYVESRLDEPCFVTFKEVLKKGESLGEALQCAVMNQIVLEALRDYINNWELEQLNDEELQSLIDYCNTPICKFKIPKQ